MDDETADPRVEFARRLQALREAAGLSIRRLEVESERTPRRRREEPVRLKRSTIAGMTNRERPVRPELVNFEVFVDTCLRIADEHDIPLPPELGDRKGWDEAYRDLRDLLDRSVRRRPDPLPRHPAPQPVDQPRPVSRPAAVEAGPPVPSTPPAEAPDEGPGAADRPSRRRLLAAVPAVLAVAGVGALASVLASRRGGRAPAGPTSSGAYSPLGRQLSPALALDDPVWSVALGSLRGRPLAVVGRADGGVQFWNPATGRALTGPVKAHRQAVYSIAVAGPLAVSASPDGFLQRWDLTAAAPTGTPLGPRATAGLNGVALGTLDGRTVAVTAGDDRTVRRWDPAAAGRDGVVLGERLDTEVKSVALTGVAGGLAAVTGSADGTVRLWDVGAGTGRILGSHPGTVWAVAAGPVAGRPVAVTGSEDGELRRWDLADPPSYTVLGRHFSPVKTVAIGAVQGRTVVIAGSDDVAIRIWDLTTGAPFGTGLTGPAKGAESIALGSLDGRALVVSGHWDGTIWTWSL